MGSSSERTRTAITAALRKKLKDLMGEFQDLRQRLQDEYRRAPALLRPSRPRQADARRGEMVWLALRGWNMQDTGANVSVRLYRRGSAPMRAGC